MSKIKRMLAIAVVGVAGVTTYQVGSGLLLDVRHARAQAEVQQTREQLATLNDLSSAFKQVNKAMEQSVVHIQVTKTMRPGPRGMDDEMLRRFFDRDGDGQPDLPEQDLRSAATGSGVIMDTSGSEAFIVTNNHVVEDGTDIEVVLQDGRHITDAKVVGTDPKTDVAVIKIKADRVIPAKWGNSDQLEKGDLIVAFGSPFGYVGSMSHGIVSATNRQAGVIRGEFAYENFIQVDAPINPGNSGGPLVNLKGEVVGINTAIASRTGSFAGIGFAIPSNQAKMVYEQLKSSGKVVRGYLGVQIADVKAATDVIRDNLESLGYTGDSGVFVRQVMRDSPAFKLLQPGDIITEINGKPLSNMTELRNKVAATAPGEEVKLTVWRDKKTETVSVKLAEQPDDRTQLTAREAVTGIDGLGLTLTTPTAEDLTAAGLAADAKGALVKEVRNGSAAAQVGIRPGDLITRVGTTPINNADEARAALKEGELNKGVRIDLLNKEGEKMVTIRRPAK